MRFTGLLFGTSLPLVAAVTIGCGDGTDPNGNGNGEPMVSANVQAIFTNSCAVSGCHGGSNIQPPEKPQDLSAGNACASIVNVASSQVPSLDRVEPQDPDNSYLVNKIEGTAADVGGTDTRMPLGLDPLSDADIQAIRDWIAAGAPECL